MKSGEISVHKQKQISACQSRAIPVPLAGIMEGQHSTDFIALLSDLRVEDVNSFEFRKQLKLTEDVRI